MAMNKKEREAFDLITKEAELNRALRWSDYPSQYDLPIPDHGSGYVNGWSINTYSASVFESWSLSVSHGHGHISPGEKHSSASQNGIAQYSTKEKACMALRRAMERKYATVLADIDYMIAKSNPEDSCAN